MDKENLLFLVFLWKFIMASFNRLRCSDAFSAQLFTRSRRQFAFLSSSMLRPQCVDISERIAEVTLPVDQQFVRLQDRKRALKLVANAHLGFVPRNVSQMILHPSSNGHSKNGTIHFTKDQVEMLKMELSKMDKLDEQYIREPAPNLNMLHPQAWYPKTRAKKRRIIYHYGPTNSGKTFHALEALKKANNGVYCAPLRLLAWEIYENLVDSGLDARLMTGEEIFGRESASHTACTVEMADVFETEWDVAIIDEIQLMGGCGQDRGWAWTRALLGIQADEVHLCGDETVKKLVKSIVSKCGDSLEFRKYQRLCPLRMDHPVTNYSQIEAGDCIVGFNRGDLYKMKNEIERNTSFKCALIYGRLPPENRRTQAKLFNAKNSGYDVLVSSDAIGMGLNLNIRRIIFSTTTKWNGVKKTPLTIHESVQIAGRAGRFGLYEEGYVSCFNQRDYKFIWRQLQQRPPKQNIACLRPEEAHVHDIAEQFPWLRFSDIVRCFKERSTINAEEFFIPDFQTVLQIAQILENVPLSVKDKYIFTTIPLRQNSIECLGFVQEWAVALSNDQLVKLEVDEQQLVDIMGSVQNTLVSRYNQLRGNGDDGGSGDAVGMNMNAHDINDVEVLYAILSCYRFLSFRFPTFVDYQKCEHLLGIAANMIQQGFDGVTIQNKYHYQQQHRK